SLGPNEADLCAVAALHQRDDRDHSADRVVRELQLITWFAQDVSHDQIDLGGLGVEILLIGWRQRFHEPVDSGRVNVGRRLGVRHTGPCESNRVVRSTKSADRADFRLEETLAVWRERNEAASRGREMTQFADAMSRIGREMTVRIRAHLSSRSSAEPRSLKVFHFDSPLYTLIARSFRRGASKGR